MSACSVGFVFDNFTLFPISMCVIFLSLANEKIILKYSLFTLVSNTINLAWVFPLFTIVATCFHCLLLAPVHFYLYDWESQGSVVGHLLFSSHTSYLSDLLKSHGLYILSTCWWFPSAGFQKCMCNHHLCYPLWPHLIKAFKHFLNNIMVICFRWPLCFCPSPSSLLSNTLDRMILLKCRFS